MVIERLAYDEVDGGHEGVGASIVAGRDAAILPSRSNWRRAKSGSKPHCRKSASCSLFSPDDFPGLSEGISVIDPDFPCYRFLGILAQSPEIRKDFGRDCAVGSENEQIFPVNSLKTGNGRLSGVRCALHHAPVSL